MFVFIFNMLCKNWFGEVNMEVRFEVFIYLSSVAKEKCLQQSMLIWVQKIDLQLFLNLEIPNEPFIYKHIRFLLPLM